MDKEEIGIIGRIHPSLNKDDIYLCELSLTKIYEKQTKPLKYKEASKYPEIVKDVAFIIDKDVDSDVLSKQIKQSGGRLLTDYNIFDLYVGENIDNDKKSIAYTLTFSDPSRTLEENEVMEVFNKIIKEVENKCNAKVRDN